MDDAYMCKKYLEKKDNAERNGIQFRLRFVSFRNMLRAKRCQYSGITLTNSRGKGKPLRFSDRTIDRIDSNKGYERGNVCVVCHGVNHLKAQFENPDSAWTIELVSKSIREINKRCKKDPTISRNM